MHGCACVHACIGVHVCVLRCVCGEEERGGVEEPVNGDTSQRSAEVAVGTMAALATTLQEK